LGWRSRLVRARTGGVHGDPRVAGQPGLHRRFVGGVVVGHNVQLDSRVGFRDVLEEAQEFLVPVPAGSRRRSICRRPPPAPRTGWSCHAGRSRGSRARAARAAAAGSVRSDPMPAPAISRRCTAQSPCPAGSHTARPHRGPSRPTPGRWRTSTSAAATAPCLGSTSLSAGPSRFEALASSRCAHARARGHGS
jgi:hypothetical protein